MATREQRRLQEEAKARTFQQQADRLILQASRMPPGAGRRAKETEAQLAQQRADQARREALLA